MKKFFDIVMPVKTAACYIFTATMCVYAVLDLVFGWGGLLDNYLFLFLLLSLGYCFKLMRLGSKRWRWYLGVFAAVSAALFVLFYPALSGLVVDNAAATKLLGWLPTWPF